MSVSKIKLFVIVTALLTTSVSGQAAVRSFFAPSLLGDRIAFCASANRLCGKPVADAWCIHNGFDKALMFQRETPSAKSDTFFVRTVDTGESCTGKSCTAFRQIKCFSAN